jgi:hypothetical protein
MTELLLQEESSAWSTVIRGRLLHEWVEALQLAWEHGGGGPVSGGGYARLRMPIGTPDNIPSHIRDCGPSESVGVPRVVQLRKWLGFRKKRNVCWIGTIKRLPETGRRAWRWGIKKSPPPP